MRTPRYMRVVGASIRSVGISMLALTGLAFEVTCAAPRHSAPPAEAMYPAPCALPPSPGDPPERAAVVVVLDGVRWQDVFLGVDPALAAAAGGGMTGAREAPMPHLRALAAARGVTLGAPGQAGTVRASGPNFVSLPGYTELFTGRPPRDCQSNDCDRATRPTVVDEIRACARSRREVAVFASWSEIERVAAAEPGEIVVSTGRHVRHGEPILREDRGRAALLDQGAEADPFPGGGDFRPDRYTAAIALGYLESEHPRFLFVGLGEADEYAHRGDYPGYLAALRTADDAIAALVHALDRMGERGRRTSVFVTADHGRAADFRDHGGEFPESARVWLIGIGGGMSGVEAASAPSDLRLADLAPTLRASVGLPARAPSADAGRVIGALLPVALQ